MRRIALCLVAFSAVIIGSTVPHVLAEDYVCPPGAKFCPVPGSGQVAMAPAGDRFAAFRSQLNEGETLIMVAPSVNMHGYPAEVAAAPAPARSPAYAAAPAPGGMPLDFIPPPPGAPRSAPPAAPAPAARTYPREPARTLQNAPAPRQTLAAAPVRRPAREAVRTGGGASAASPATLSPDSFGAPRAAANQAKKPRRADMLSEVANETSRKSSKSGAMKSSSRDDREKKSPARKDREKDDKDKTDKKNSRKNKRDGKERTDEDRVPWWKGGFWRNRGK